MTAQKTSNLKFHQSPNSEISHICIDLAGPKFLSDCNSVHIYLAVRPLKLNGTYLWVDIYRIAVLDY